MRVGQDYFQSYITLVPYPRNQLTEKNIAMTSADEVAILNVIEVSI